MPELQPGQFEAIIGHYANDWQPPVMPRYQAELLAENSKGKIIPAPLSEKPGVYFYTLDVPWRIVSTRLEDDPTNSAKGRVIAICEPVEQHPEPYKPDMEYK